MDFKDNEAIYLQIAGYVSEPNKSSSVARKILLLVFILFSLQKQVGSG